MRYGVYTAYGMVYTAYVYGVYLIRHGVVVPPQDNFWHTTFPDLSFCRPTTYNQMHTRLHPLADVSSPPPTAAPTPTRRRLDGRYRPMKAPSLLAKTLYTTAFEVLRGSPEVIGSAGVGVGVGVCGSVGDGSDVGGGGWFCRIPGR